MPIPFPTVRRQHRIRHIKEQKEWKADRLQDYKEQRQEVEESRKKMQAEGFASQKTEAQVRNALEDAGIPTTENNMAKVMTAMGMSREALSIDDSTKAYIVGQDILGITGPYPAKHRNRNLQHIRIRLKRSLQIPVIHRRQIMRMQNGFLPMNFRSIRIHWIN